MIMTNFKKARNANRLSQLEIATALGVKQPTVSAWENGTKYPSSENLRALCKLLNVSADYLLDKTNAQHPDKIPQKEKPAEIGEFDEKSKYIVNSYKEFREEDQKSLVDYIEFLKNRRKQ